MTDNKKRKRVIPLWVSLTLPLPVLFIGFAVLVVFSVGRSTDSIANNFAAALTQKTTGEIEALVGQYLGEAHTYHKSIIASSNAGNINLDDMNALTPMLYQYSSISNRIRTFYYGDADEQTCYMSVGDDGSGIVGIQEKHNVGKMPFYEIHQGGIKGSFIEEIDFTVTERSWFKDAAKRRLPGFTEIYVDAVTGTLVISPYTPVFGETSNLRGVLGSDIFLDSLVEIVDRADSGTGAHSVIVDESGLMVAAYSGLDIVRTVNGELTRLRAEECNDSVIAETITHNPLDAVSTATFQLIADSSVDAETAASQLQEGNIIENWYDTVRVDGERYFANIKPLTARPVRIGG